MPPVCLPTTRCATTHMPQAWEEVQCRLFNPLLMRSTENLGLPVEPSELFGDFVEKSKHLGKYSVVGSDFFSLPK